MKSMLIFKKTFNICCIILFVFSFASCDEYEYNENELSRLFRPSSFSRSVESTTVTLSWKPIKNATYYIEYGRAAAGTPFSEVEDLQTLTLGRVSTYQLTDLWGSTRYAIRIKAVSTIPEVKDSEYVTSNFTTGAENIFYPLTYEYDGSSFSILAKWDKTKEVTHLVIYNLQLGNKTIPLSQADIEAGEKRIENSPEYRLRVKEEYEVSIYLDERQRGKNSVRLQYP